MINQSNKQKFLLRHPKAGCCTIWVQTEDDWRTRYAIFSATGKTEYGRGKTERQAWAAAVKGMK